MEKAQENRLSDDPVNVALAALEAAIIAKFLASRSVQIRDEIRSKSEEGSFEQFSDPLRIAQMAVQIYAETHPRPSHVTQKQTAEMLGLSAPTVCKMVRAGQIKLNRAGLVPIAEVDRLLETESIGEAEWRR